MNTNEARNKAEVVDVQTEGGDNTSTAKQVSPPQDPKFTLKLSRVEVAEIFSILDEWTVTTSSYNQLAIILRF